MNQEQNIPKELDDYNWAEAFGAAGKESSTVNPDIRPAYPTSNISLEPFARWDVKRVLALSEGERDSQNWLALVELNDGRYAFVDAGCDYSGWG